MDAPLPTLLFLWPLAWLLASVVYRKARGKPILFFTLPGATFLERSASGHSNDNVLRRLGGARNCLVVGVVGRRLVVRPWCPFNLGFIPELYALEHEIDLGEVVDAKVDRFAFRKRLVVSFRSPDRDVRSLTLFLQEPEQLCALLVPAGPSA